MSSVQTLSLITVFFLFAGLQSGFVTLPRLSRIDRQLQEADARKHSDNAHFSLTRSDSLTSFTVDLGPSLMTEVLSFFDNPGCLQMSVHSQAAVEEEEDGREDEEGEDSSSLTETPQQSPTVTSPDTSMSSGSFRRNINSRGRSFGSDRTDRGAMEERRSLKAPDASAGSPPEKPPGMEAERFQRAADVLSRHYGGQSVTKGRSNNSASPDSPHSPKTPAALSEEEEEIKV